MSSPATLPATRRDPRKEDDTSDRARWRGWLPIGLLLLWGLLAFSNSFRGDLIFDDLFALVWNDEAAKLRPINPFNFSNRELPRFTFALQLRLHGPESARNAWLTTKLHIFNLVVHLLAGLSLYGFARRTLLLPQFKMTRSQADWLGFAIAGIWLVHPLQTESVTYIVQRFESLMGMLFLCCFYLSLRAAQSPQPVFWTVAAVLAFWLGMETKETMAVAPFLLVLYDRCYLWGTWREVGQRRWPFYLGCLPPVLLFAAKIFSQIFLPKPPESNSTMGFRADAVTPWEYFRSQPEVILNYLKLSFWPDTLILDYGWPVASVREAVLPGLVMIALFVGSLYLLFRRPAWGWMAIFFFITLAPTSSIVPIKDLSFEHRMYLPLASVAAGVVLLGWRATRLLLSRGVPEGVIRTLQAGLICLVLLVLSVRTFARNADYRSPVRFLTKAVQARPDYARNWVNLGNAYRREGRYREAYAAATRAIELDPKDPQNFANRGFYSLMLNEYDRAMEDFVRATEVDPKFADGWNNRAFVWIERGRYTTARRDALQGLKVFPGHINSLYNLARAEWKLGRHKLALQRIEMCLEQMPDYGAAWRLRGGILYDLGRHEEAITSLTRSLEFEPNHPDAIFERGRAWLGLAIRHAGEGRSPAVTKAAREAVEDFSRLIGRNASHVDAHQKRAMAWYILGERERMAADIEAIRRIGVEPDPQLVALLRGG